MNLRGNIIMDRIVYNKDITENSKIGELQKEKKNIKDQMQARNFSLDEMRKANMRLKNIDIWIDTKRAMRKSVTLTDLENSKKIQRKDYKEGIINKEEFEREIAKIDHAMAGIREAKRLKRVAKDMQPTNAPQSSDQPLGSLRAEVKTGIPTYDVEGEKIIRVPRDKEAELRFIYGEEHPSKPLVGQSIPPTQSSELLHDTVAGLEPNFSKAYVRRVTTLGDRPNMNLRDLAEKWQKDKSSVFRVDDIELTYADTFNNGVKKLEPEFNADDMCAKDILDRHTRYGAGLIGMDLARGDDHTAYRTVYGSEHGVIKLPRPSMHETEFGSDIQRHVSNASIQDQSGIAKLVAEMSERVVKEYHARVEAIIFSGLSGIDMETVCTDTSRESLDRAIARLRDAGKLVVDKNPRDGVLTRVDFESAMSELSEQSKTTCDSFRETVRRMNVISNGMCGVPSTMQFEPVKLNSIETMLAEAKDIEWTPRNRAERRAGKPLDDQVDFMGADPKPTFRGNTIKRKKHRR